MVSASVMPSDCNPLPPTSMLSPPKIDATDRRIVEAHNEDKSHQTKEVLDDIKRVHRKEKKKKQKNEIEQHQSGIGSESWVSKTLLNNLSSVN